MKNKKRKGFTLVELLVVIAILAILATVSILGYTSFTKKANESVDEQAVTQMNLVLQANEVLQGKSINEAYVSRDHDIIQYDQPWQMELN